MVRVLSSTPRVSKVADVCFEWEILLGSNDEEILVISSSNDWEGCGPLVVSSAPISAVAVGVVHVAAEDTVVCFDIISLHVFFY